MWSMMSFAGSLGREEGGGEVEEGDKEIGEEGGEMGGEEIGERGGEEAESGEEGEMESANKQGEREGDKGERGGVSPPTISPINSSQIPKRAPSTARFSAGRENKIDRINWIRNSTTSTLPTTKVIF